MFLRDELEAKLAQFNGWMSKDAIRSVIETLQLREALLGVDHESRAKIVDLIVEIVTR